MLKGNERKYVVNNNILWVEAKSLPTLHRVTSTSATTPIQMKVNMCEAKMQNSLGKVLPVGS